MANKKGKNTRPPPKRKPRSGGAAKSSAKKAALTKKQTLTANLTGVLPTVNSSLTDMATQRATISTLTTQRSANATQVVQLKAQRQQLERTGASAAQLAKVDSQIAKLRDKQTSLAGQLRTANDALANLRDRMAIGVEPEQLVATLDGKVPILLLPVRLETRFFNDDTELRIRIYPDQAHLNGHEPELTDAELRAGKWYMEQHQNAATPEIKREAWRALVQRFGARRSRWITDSVQQPSPPATKSASWTRAIQAIALPDRWVAIGYQGATEVFRKWSLGVPDALAVSLTPIPGNEDEEPPLPDDELPIDEGMRWTIDYKRALAEGMAITVTDADLSANRKLKNGLTRLIVFGVDWTLTPTASANAIAELFKAHRFSDGFEFLKPGTPTNNTGVTRSGLNENENKLADLYDPNLPATGGAKGTASQLLMQGLGLDVDAAKSLSLDHTPGAESTEQLTASKLLNVTWRGTLGYYLDEMLNADTDAGDDNPLISDATLKDTRTHVKNYLFPGGPLPSVRIGKQPYGILPVVAPRFQPAPNDRFSGRLLSLLSKMRPFWLRGLRAVPRVTNATSRDSLDEILLKILQTTPQASTARFRRVFGSATAANTDGLKKYEEIQADVLFQIIRPHFGWSKPPRITEFVTDPRSYNLPVPWVQANGVSEAQKLEPNYIEEIANILRGTLGPDARAVLVAQENADNLLQALLALAAVEEMDYSARQLVYLHHQNIGVFETLARAPRVQIAEMLFTEKVESRESKVYSRAELSKVILPSVTIDVPLAVYITKAAGDRQLLRQNQFIDLASFLEDLDGLAAASSAEIERAFRGVLDCYSHRLDAWYTSLATRRLHELRTVQKVTGLYIGGYGWVEHLIPETQPDSLGYVHAPSIPQAITAALLRSAHLSHQTGENNPGQTPFNVDLSSQRVRIALEVINGVARGQPLAALLGYRFERSLREPDATLAKFILPFRRLAALRPNLEAVPADQSVESIAARDVVDGVKLLEHWRNEKDQLFARFNDPLISDEPPNQDQKNKIAKVLDDLADVLDAASDVLAAESVYQTVLGNYERSNAATAALDRQERPVAPDVVHTPRTGKAYTQRVMVLFGSGGLPQGWSQSSDPRSKAEPRVNAWIGSLLGDPKKIRIAARVLKERTDGKPPDEIKRLSATIDALGLSPLSLVFTSAPGGQKKPSELEERLAMHFASLVPDGDEHTIIELLEAPPAGATAGAIGLGELRAILDWIRALISDRRAADARDLALAEESPEDGITDAELKELNDRLTTLTKNVSDTILSLEGATNALGLRKALHRAAALNTPNALPRTTLNDAKAVAKLKAQAQEAVEHLKRVDKEIAESNQKIAGKTPGKFELAQHRASLIKMVFGKAFPVLTTFKPVNPAELNASLADQAALNNNDTLAPVGWLRKMALVRPGADTLTSVLSGASLLGSSAVKPSSFSLIQLPHRPGQHWQALSFANDAIPTGEVAICAHIHGKLNVTKALAGFVCDEWLEVIPNAVETTALSFHYDAPGARPPHMMILAVPPEFNMQNWDFQTLSDTIMETFALAQLRAVGPKEMQVLGGTMLPAVYLPNNFTKDVPSTDLLKIREKYLDAVVASGVVGKEFLKGS